MNFNNLPKSFCILPWIHTAINPTGEVKPCCMSEHNYAYGNLNETPLLKDIFTGEKANQLRKEMINNVDRLPAACNKCQTVDASGMPSYRVKSNEKYKDVVEALTPNADGTTEFKQLYIDYRFSNKCNFKCITCGPGLSSSHAVEFIKLGKKTPDFWDGKTALVEVDSKSFLQQFKEFSKDVREIYFAGGEPLINDHHYDILQWIIDTQQPIHIFYNTNFSNLTYRNHDLLDMWSKVNGVVDIYASVDGFGEEGELIRYGFDQSVFESNVKKLFDADLPNVRMHFSITHGITNYRQVVATTEWLMNQVPKKYTDARVGFNPILYSTEYSECFLNTEQRIRARELIQAQLEDLRSRVHPDRTGLNYVDAIEKNYLVWVNNLDKIAYPDEGKRKQIRGRWIHMNSIDGFRGTDWKTSLPDMVNDYIEIWNDLDARGIETDATTGWKPINDDGTLNNDIK